MKSFEVPARPVLGLSLVVALLLAPQAHARNVSTPLPPKAKKVAPAPQGRPYALRPDVMGQAPDIAARRDLDPHWVHVVLGKARFAPTVAQLIAPPPAGTAKNWRAYRARFVEPIRIQAGVKFWRAHQGELERAERDYGVPPEIIVGILGVETMYGKYTGQFRVIDALATLAFDFPASHPRAAERSALFKGELEQFLSLHHRAGTDPFAAKGSFAGAMGLPQFLPSSWVRYAVDFDGDGKIDLTGSPADAIGSVANYFKSFNWQPGMPSHYPLELAADAPNRDVLLAPDILPTFTAERLQSLGLSLAPAAAQHKGLLAVVEMQNGDPSDPLNAPTHVLGTDNFYAITRYNWSSYYALAVIELGSAIGQEMRP